MTQDDQKSDKRELEARLAEAVRVLSEARDKQYDEKKRGLDQFGQKVILRDAVIKALDVLFSPTNSEARGGCEHDKGHNNYSNGKEWVASSENTCPFCDKKTGGV